MHTRSVAPRRGFTLIELLVVLGIAAVLMLLAAPTLGGLTTRMITGAEANRLLGAFVLARNEALQRNVPVTLCPSAYARSGIPRCEGVLAGGWLVFANPGRDRQFDVATDRVLQGFEALEPGYQLTDGRGERQVATVFTYLPEGSSRTAATLRLCRRQQTLVPVRKLVINRIGRPRLEREQGSCREPGA